MFYTPSGASRVLARLLLLIAPIGLIAPACQKEELKEPSEVDLGFQVENEDPSIQGQGQGQGNGSSIELRTKNEGELSIQEVRLIGTRKEGEDVDFSREESVELPIKDVRNGPKVRFDLPQGTYEDMKLRFELAKDGKGGVQYEGERIMKKGNGPAQATPFRLIIEEEKSIECKVDPSNGQGTIELRKGEPRKIEVKVRPAKWFEKTPPGLWRNAKVVPKGGKQMIPVRRGNNRTLHSKVLKRIDKGFNASIL